MNKKDTGGQEDITANAAEEVKQETPPVEAEKTPEEKLAEINDKYVRLYAEFDNFRKRASKERIDLLKYAGEDIFKQLIPVMDDFDRAMKASEKTTDIKTIKEGEQLIYNKFKNLLTQSGVAEMKATGKSFDPEFHDAVTNIPAPKEDMKGKVVEEVEKGYWLNGKVLRHAKVIVGQ
ncbi:MAG: nucleotide exchange factor GrpE [Bacteroidetes bacterium]|nr:MAG: nucleotide exchange factor GrpE [Bacteroidota bacterium]